MMPAYIKNKIWRSGMKKKLYIGIVAQIGAGKDTVARYIEVFYNAKALRSSDMLGEILEILNLDPTKRAHLQKLPVAIRNTFGSKTISRAMVRRMKKQKENIVIWNGIRYPSDVDEFRRLPNSILIGVVAPESVRFRRIKERKEKTGEENLTLKQFREEQGKETEINTLKLIDDADYKILNNKTLNTLHKQIAHIIESQL